MSYLSKINPLIKPRFLSSIIPRYYSSSTPPTPPLPPHPPRPSFSPISDPSSHRRHPSSDHPSHSDPSSFSDSSMFFSAPESSSYDTPISLSEAFRVRPRLTFPAFAALCSMIPAIILFFYQGGTDQWGKGEEVLKKIKNNPAMNTKEMIEERKLKAEQTMNVMKGIIEQARKEREEKKEKKEKKEKEEKGEKEEKKEKGEKNEKSSAS